MPQARPMIKPRLRFSLVGSRRFFIGGGLFSLPSHPSPRLRALRENISGNSPLSPLALASIGETNNTTSNTSTIQRAGGMCTFGSCITTMARHSIITERYLLYRMQVRRAQGTTLPLSGARPMAVAQSLSATARRTIAFAMPVRSVTIRARRREKQRRLSPQYPQTLPRRTTTTCTLGL